jgi:hypothetical protein
VRDERDGMICLYNETNIREKEETREGLISDYGKSRREGIEKR